MSRLREFKNLFDRGALRDAWADLPGAQACNTLVAWCEANESHCGRAERDRRNASVYAIRQPGRVDTSAAESMTEGQGDLSLARMALSWATKTQWRDAGLPDGVSRAFDKVVAACLTVGLVEAEVTEALLREWLSFAPDPRCS